MELSTSLIESLYLDQYEYRLHSTAILVFHILLVPAGAPSFQANPLSHGLFDLATLSARVMGPAHSYEYPLAAGTDASFQGTQELCGGVVIWSWWHIVRTSCSGICCRFRCD
jgi:hypothetical protein